MNLIIILILICILFLPFYMLIRNEHVYSYRLKVIRNDDISKKNPKDWNIEKLPTYNEMLFQVFKFNWDEYLEK